MRLTNTKIAAALLAATLLFLPAMAQTADTNKSISTGASDELFPPNAKPGECYARVFVPATYRTDTERVVVKPASERIEIIPATYGWVEERVMTKEASTRLELVPATYKWIEERVMTKEASTRLEKVPEAWETVTEQVLDQPAHTVWKKGKTPLQKVDGATGEIMCLVEIPATYRTVTKRVLKSPATTREIKIPAEYKTVRRRVLATPATTREITIPAEYETVRVRKVVKAPQTTKIAVPSESRTVTHTTKITDGYMAWKGVLCEVNADKVTIMKIQRALRAAGENPGEIDGVIGRDTMSALNAFQRKNHLAAGQITLETLAKLGVKL